MAAFAHTTDGNAIGLFTSSTSIVPVTGLPTGVPAAPVSFVSHPISVHDRAFDQALIIHPREAVWPGATPII